MNYENIEWTEEKFQLVEQSLDTWKRHLDGEETEGSPQCSIFNPPTEGARFKPCGGCPVAQYTGFSKCLSTPFFDWFFAPAGTPEETARGHEMVAFLTDLVDEGRKALGA